MSIGGSHGGAATGVMNTAGQVGGVMCTLAFGYIVGTTGNYELPVRAVALMVLIAALVFSIVDCTAGLPSPNCESATAPSLGDGV